VAGNCPLGNPSPIKTLNKPYAFLLRMGRPVQTASNSNLKSRETARSFQVGDPRGLPGRTQMNSPLVEGAFRDFHNYDIVFYNQNPNG